jgi:hypothetical protein
VPLELATAVGSKEVIQIEAELIKRAFEGGCRVGEGKTECLRRT